MRYFAITILFLLSFIPIQSQTADSIAGNWKFKDIYTAEKIDSTARNAINKMFAEMSLNLKPDHLYEASLFSKENGNWEYLSESKQLELRSGKGKNDKIKVISVTNTELVLEITKNNALVMEKITTELKE